MDNKLAFAGLRALGLMPHPRGEGKLFNAPELGGGLSRLKGEQVKWAAGSRSRKLFSVGRTKPGGGSTAG
jgi:hypothetical protein